MAHEVVDSGRYIDYILYNVLFSLVILIIKHFISVLNDTTIFEKILHFSRKKSHNRHLTFCRALNSDSW